MKFIDSLHNFKRNYFSRINFETTPGLSLLRSSLIKISRQSFVPDIHGHEMFLDPQDSLALSWYKTFEPEETEFFMRAIRPGQRILDIGANIGYFTLIFARAVGPHGHVYAFEPEPALFEILSKNVAANGYKNVTLVNKAVSDKNGTARLFLNAHNRGDNRLSQGDEHEQNVLVETIALDSFFQDKDEPISFVKIDIQGNEYWALEGMRQLLKKNQDVFFITEYMPSVLRNANTQPKDYLQALEAFGFQFHLIKVGENQVRKTTLEEIQRLCPGKKNQFINLVCCRNTTSL